MFLFLGFWFLSAFGGSFAWSIMVPHHTKQLVFWFEWFVKEIGMLPTYYTTFFRGCNGLRSKWVCCHILLFFGWGAVLLI
jgi:hypothetical protein